METNLRGGGGKAVDEEKRKAGNFRGNLSSCDRPGPSWWNDNEGIGTKTTIQSQQMLCGHHYQEIQRR